MPEFTRIKYSHYKDVENISFTTGTSSNTVDWHGYFYIPYVPKGNDVKYIEEIEDRNGVEIKKSSIVQEVKTIRFMASEPQIRSWQKLPMFSDIRIKSGDLTEEVARNFKFSIDSWLGSGAFAMCKIEYTTNIYVSKTTSRDIL
jgi:hypothetical protein